MTDQARARVLDQIEAMREEALDSFAEVMRIPSISGTPAGN